MQTKELRCTSVFSSTPTNGTIGQCKEGLALGFMIAYIRPLKNGKKGNIGQIVAIREYKFKISRYLQKANSAWEKDKSFLQQVGKIHPLKSYVTNVVCHYQLTRAP